MKKVEIGGLVVEMYDDIEDLPLRNYQKFNKYLIADSGIGSDMADVDTHIQRIASLIGKDNDKVLRELQNLHNNIAMLLSEVSPKLLSFAALVRSVNGEVNDDLSDEGLKRLAAKLELATIREVDRELEDSKKKLEEELLVYFPKYFSDVEAKKADNFVRRRCIAILGCIVNGGDVRKAVEPFDDELLGRYKPKTFAGRDSALVKYDKNFEQSCLVVAQKSGIDPKTMTVQQYYSALENIEKQIKAEQKGLKKH